MNEEYDNVDDEDNLLDEEDPRNGKWKQIPSLSIEMLRKLISFLLRQYVIARSYPVDGLIGVPPSSL